MTLQHISEAILDDSGRGPKGPHAGAAWVAQVKAAAIHVLAQDRSPDELLHEVTEHWTLDPGR
jgi:hypothetical protein